MSPDVTGCTTLGFILVATERIAVARMKAYAVCATADALVTSNNSTASARPTQEGTEAFDLLVLVSVNGAR